MLGVTEANSISCKTYNFLREVCRGRSWKRTDLSYNNNTKSDHVNVMPSNNKKIVQISKHIINGKNGSCFVVLQIHNQDLNFKLS